VGIASSISAAVVAEAESPPIVRASAEIRVLPIGLTLWVERWRIFGGEFIVFSASLLKRQTTSRLIASLLCIFFSGVYV
jgi:hypothetical protein